MRGLSSAALQYVVEHLAPGGRVVRYRPLRGGVSATVFVVHLETKDHLRNAVVLRRFDAGWHDPDTCTREFKVLEALSRWSFPAPRALLVEQGGGPFGAPALVTTRLPGRPILVTDNVEDYVRQIAATLARIHALPINGFGFLRDQRVLLTEALANQPIANDPLEPALREGVVAEWPRVSMSRTRTTLVHSDYWPGNLLWWRGRLVGVVDWEDARLGDPARDVAICRADLTSLFGREVADAFLREYEAISGNALPDMPFWDRVTVTLALPELEYWKPGWDALGRTDLSVDTARERFRSLV